MPELKITKEMLTEALVEYTARRLGVAFPLQHKIRSNCSLIGLSDELFTVKVEHLENVLVLFAEKQSKEGTSTGKL